jgi:hypothetical protein
VAAQNFTLSPLNTIFKINDITLMQAMTMFLTSGQGLGSRR